jgi:hypothetical protein
LVEDNQGDNMKIPTVKVPKFTTTLPVSGEKIEFRPFLVKEEKLLLLASESSDTDSAVNAISDIVESCTNSKVKSSEYCLADVQWLFLQIRGKSIGEEVNVYLLCGECGAKHLKTMSLKDFSVALPKDPNGHIIKVDDVVQVELKYPTIFHYNYLFENKNENDVYKVVADCIVKIYNEDEVFVNEGTSDKELLEFIENLTSEQFEKFEQFFVQMPVLTKVENFVCTKCETSNKFQVNSIEHFFA